MLYRQLATSASKRTKASRGSAGVGVWLHSTIGKGEAVEVALHAEQQNDGRFFFEALWVLVYMAG